MSFYNLLQLKSETWHVENMMVQCFCSVQEIDDESQGELCLISQYDEQWFNRIMITFKYDVINWKAMTYSCFVRFLFVEEDLTGEEEEIPPLRG